MDSDLILSIISFFLYTIISFSLTGLEFIAIKYIIIFFMMDFRYP